MEIVIVNCILNIPYYKQFEILHTETKFRSTNI